MLALLYARSGDEQKAVQCYLEACREERSLVFRGNLDLFYQLVGNSGTLFNTTDVIDTYVFRLMFNSKDNGRITAIGLYQSVLCFFTIILANYIVKKKNPDYSLF